MSRGQAVYTVTITNDNEKGAISGQLRETHPGNRQAAFDPLTVLGDLFGILIPPYNRFRAGYTEHPFFLGREYSHEENTEGISMNVYDDTPSQTLLEALNALPEIFILNRRLSMSEFEIIKQAFRLRFSCEIGFKHESISHMLGMTEDFSGKAVHEFDYRPISETYDYDINAMFEQNKDRPYQFTYTCHGMEDIIFSVLHYLVMMKYKFNQCSHCLQYFATTTFKQKYCNRKSLYPGFEKHNCEQAVRNIKQNIARNKKTIYDNLGKYYEPKALHDFLDAYDIHRGVVDDYPTVETLRKLEMLVGKGKDRNRWYNKEYRK
jgi:hypothetical protein